MSISHSDSRTAIPKPFKPDNRESIEEAGIWAATKMQIPDFDSASPFDPGFTLDQVVKASQHDLTWFMSRAQKPGK